MSEFKYEHDGMGEPPFEQEQMFGRGYLKKLYPRRRAFDEAAQERYWMHILVEMALSTIKWNDVPDTIDARAMEYILLHFGCAAAFVENGNLLFAQASFADEVNMYYNPNKVMLMAPDGRSWKRHAEDYVTGTDDDGAPVIATADAAVVWDNMLRAPLLPLLRNYARRLAHYDAIIDANVEAQKTPWIIAAPPESKRNAKEWQYRLESGDQYIPVNEGSALPYTLDTAAPYVAGNVKDLQRTILNEVFTLLGVDNSNVDKRERVQTAEVLSNNDQVMALREARMKSRVQFAERCNELFGTDISVEWALEGELANVAANMQGGGFGGLGVDQEARDDE